MKNANDIMAKLEDGVKAVFESENYRNYLTTMGKFHNYSFGNCIMIAIQRPDATQVAGFKAWKTKFHRTVKKGEKGIQILAPCPHKRTIDVPLADGGTEQREITFITYRAAYVFDVSQTEGEDLPEIVKTLSADVTGYDELITKLIAVSPVPVSFEEVPGGANGFFSWSEKRIVVKAGMSQSQTVKTLVHEIAHSILHDKENGEQKDADRRTMEVQAESVSYAVNNYLGIDSSDYSFGYVAGWSSGKDVKELKASLEVIHKTAVDIIDRLEEAAE